jgi:hypothetical protein
MPRLTSLQAYAKTQPKPIYQQEESQGEWRAPQALQRGSELFSGTK